MRILALSSLALLPLAQVTAQGDEVVRNNEPYLVISTGTSPGGNNYNWPPVNPGNYSTAGASVSADQWVWRTMEGQTIRRGEPFLVSGYTGVWRMSAATQDLGNGPAYIPRIRVMPTTQDANGLPVPDWTPGNEFFDIAAADGMNQGGTFVFSETLPTVAVTLPVLSAAPPVEFQGLAIGLKYQGGENQDVAATVSTTNPGFPNDTYSQGTCGSYSDGNLAGYITDGFTEIDESTTPPTVSNEVRKSSDFAITWISILTDNPSINIYSDYGKRRFAQALTPPLLGNSYGSYFSDMDTTVAAEFGIQVRANGTTYGNSTAILLFNFGQLFPAALPFPPVPGQVLTLELAPFDPSFTAFAGSLPLLLDQDGDGDSTNIGPLPILAGSLGQYLGFEAVVVDTTFASWDSTEAVWIEVKS